MYSIPPVLIVFEIMLLIWHGNCTFR